MALLNIQNTKTAEQVALEVTNNIREAVKNFYEQSINFHRNQYHQTWNQVDCTPQQVFSALGTDAGEFVTIASNHVDFLAAISTQLGIPFNAGEFAPKQPLTINPDDTVTVG